MSKNKVKFGLSNCYMAPITAVSSSNVYTYGTPIAVPGAVNLSLDPAGDTDDFYADNVIYFSSTANQGYEGDLEIAMIPDAIRTSILGETVDSNGAYVETSADKAVGFAFGFQINGDTENRKFWYYNCSVTRPTTSSGTIEATITPNTDTLTIKAMPRLGDNKVRVFMEKTDDNTTAYNSFFTAVYESTPSA